MTITRIVDYRNERPPRRPSTFPFGFVSEPSWLTPPLSTLVRQEPSRLWTWIYWPHIVSAQSVGVSHRLREFTVDARRRRPAPFGASQFRSGGRASGHRDPIPSPGCAHCAHPRIRHSLPRSLGKLVGPRAADPRISAPGDGPKASFNALVGFTDFHHSSHLGSVRLATESGTAFGSFVLRS
jgi:hypothetical protein